MTLTLLTDRRLIRAEASSTRFVLARVTAPRADGSRAPVDVALVLDRSGSMADERKFTLAREAVEQALRMLQPTDRFSLVVYDTQIDLLSHSQLATGEAKRRALLALGEIAPRGGTNLGAGWVKGCEQLAQFQERTSVSRCLLLTDGLANEGMTDAGALAMHAAELRRRGVGTSTFGVGADFDERLLRDMAHEGGGNFYFIEAASQIPELLTSELGEALEITLRNATLVVRANGEEEVELLNRFRFARDGERGALRVELGDLTSAQEMDVLLRTRFPRGTVEGTASVLVELHADGQAVAGGAGAVQWTYASHADNDAQPRNREVDRAVAEIFAARARAEAVEANRMGDFDAAERVLRGTMRRIMSYAGSDAELKAIARHLDMEMPDYTVTAMSALALKQRMYLAETQQKARSPLGQARRRAP